MTRPPGRRVLVALAGAGIGLLALGGCARVIVSPIAVPPYRIETAASYDDTWKALIRALIMENVPLRVVAKESGVIASDDFVSPIGVYADCGRFGDAVLEGDALIAFTVFVQPGENGGDRASGQRQDAHPGLSARLRSEFSHPSRSIRACPPAAGRPT